MQKKFQSLGLMKLDVCLAKPRENRLVTRHSRATG